MFNFFKKKYSTSEVKSFSDKLKISENDFNKLTEKEKEKAISIFDAIKLCEEGIENYCEDSETKW